MIQPILFRTHILSESCGYSLVIDAPLPAHTGRRYPITMPDQITTPNLTAMQGRRKGGASAVQASIHQGIAALADAFLTHLAVRAYSQGSIDAHRWALRQFSAWAAERGAHDPNRFMRSDLEAYQLFLHHYRSPRGGKTLVISLFRKICG